MHIYIPSLSRFSKADLRRGPLKLLPQRWLKKTTLVVHQSEMGQYQRALFEAKIGVEIVEMEYTGIAEKRTKIGRLAQSRGQPIFLFLDDDVGFLRRVDDERVNQRTIKDPEEVGKIFDTLAFYALEYPQVGIGLREGNNHTGVGPVPLLRYCGRCIRCVAYHTDLYVSLDTARLPLMSDLDTTLQILRQGKMNAILHYWMTGQMMTNAPGGCSTFRTRELHAQCAQKMTELHPGLVRLVEKANTSGGELGKRTEVVIQWKRAFEEGVRDANRRQVPDTISRQAESTSGI